MMYFDPEFQFSTLMPQKLIMKFGTDVERLTNFVKIELVVFKKTQERNEQFSD